MLLCPKCQQVLARVTAVCPGCGYPLLRHSAAASRGPSRNVARTGEPQGLWRNRYRLLELVAHRRTSAVYRALDELTGVTVAIKRLSTIALLTGAEREQAVRLFRREAQRLVTLQHQQVAPILDYWCEKDECYLVSKWVDGISLLQLHRQGPMPEPQLVELGLKLCEALCALHSQQPPILLRDLKMSHVIITPSTEAVIVDLGLGRFFRPGQAQGASERGTPPYEAPEQAEFGHASPQSDIYALGTLLLALATGPAPGMARLSERVRAALSRARQRDPLRRWPDARSFAEALRAAAAQQVPPALEHAVLLLTKQLRVVREPGRDTVLLRLRLQNSGSEPALVQLRSALRWLRPASRTVEVPSGAVLQVPVQVDLTAAPAGRQRFTRAMLIDSGRPQWVSVELEESAPSLAVSSSLVDFGVVGPEETTATLLVSNAGSGLLQAKANVRYPWLRVRPTQLLLAAGEQLPLTVVLDASRARHAGTYEDALLIDSDWGQAAVSIRFELARRALHLPAPDVHLGPIPGDRPVQTSAGVENRGEVPLALRATAREQWISISPKAARIPPGETLALRVRVDPRALPPGAFRSERAIELETEAGREFLSVSGVVLRPLLATSERAIDFGALRPGELSSAQKTLVVSNRGSSPLRFRARPQVPWLGIWPEEGSLQPGQSTALVLRPVPSAIVQPGTYSHEQAIAIDSDGGSLTVSCLLLLVRGQFAVEPGSVDFGLISPHSLAERQLRLTNPGTAPVHWQANTDATWLELVPISGELPPGASQVLSARAYALALPPEQGEARAAILLTWDEGRLVIPARVAISRPQLLAEPSVDLGESVDYGPLSGTLWVFNRGAGELAAEVVSNLEWVTVVPERVVVGTGSSAAVQVRAEPPESLEPGRHVLADAIALRAEGQEATVALTLALRAAPRISVVPDRLVLAPGQEATVSVRNSGRVAARLEVVAELGAIAVSPPLLTIRPGGRARLKVVAAAEPPTDLPLPLSGKIILGAEQPAAEVEVVLTRAQT